MKEKAKSKKNKKRVEVKITRKGKVFFILAFFLMSIACFVFALLCLQTTSSPFLIKHAVLFSLLTTLVICLACILSVWFAHSGKETLTKTFFSGYLLVLFVLVLLFILQKTGFFEVMQSTESLQKYIEEAGAWMPIVFIALQYLQTVILPIPTAVSTVAGVALFGGAKTALYSLIGIIPASITAFFIGRKLGYKAVAWMIGQDTLDKWQKKLKGKDNFILTLMFILPVFPDDVLCFVAGLSSMSTKYFCIMIVISRVLGITSTSFLYEYLPITTWWGILIWALLFIAVIVAFFLVYKNMDKIQAWLSKRFRKQKNKEEK